MVKNFSSADGTSLQSHALPLQTEHHDDMAGALIRDRRS